MTRYADIRLRGNPVAAFAVLRKEAPPPRELTFGERLARAEAIEAEKARRIRVQKVREKRLTYQSDMHFFAALRKAAAGDENDEGGDE